MKIFTIEDERQRLQNIEYAENSVKKCTQRVRIHNYIPGQISYNLGDYPAKFSIKPTEYDYNTVKMLAEKGVGLIQVHEEWNDSIRVLGADKYTSHDPEGMKEFIDLCHSFGIKVLPYVSSGFFDARDPECREEFFKSNDSLYSSYFRYRIASAKSPEWRSFLMGKLRNLLDEYNFDGLYNDMGYENAGVLREQYRDDSFPYNPYIEDLLSEMYSLIKERNGIAKLHVGWNVRPTTKDKIYDYLWVGESVTDSKSMLMTASYEPYILPCPDYKCITDNNCEEFYAQTLPFMQFPLGLDGRPLTEKKINVEGVDYLDDSLKDFYVKAGEWHKEHPDGPHVYSEWSSIPDNVHNRELWEKYLKLYKPMVEENNICHLNVTESTLVKGEMPENVYMSLFTGVEQYICISNLGKNTVIVPFTEKWQDCETGEILTEINLTPDRVRFMKKKI